MASRLAGWAGASHPVPAVFRRCSKADARSASSTHTQHAGGGIGCAVLFTSRSRMPIQPAVKAVLRKDLLLGGGAGTLLCAALVGAAFPIGPLLGIDWGRGPAASSGAAEAARLPAIAPVANPSADVLRARGPRVAARRAQPTTPRAAPRPAARPPAAPTVVGRSRQPIVTPVPAPSSAPAPGGGTGTPDTDAVPAPAAPAVPALVAPAAV